MDDPATKDEPTAALSLLALYDRALPQVYGYLTSRCGDVALAEDLTSQTFLAAVAAVQADPQRQLTIGWLVTVARRRLVDHWRAAAREERKLRIVDRPSLTTDDGDERLDAAQAQEALRVLSPMARAALTLRYLDDLPVREVATLLGRTEHATEALLVRSRHAFRRAYGERSPDAR